MPSTLAASPIATWSVSQTLQERFAALSGDRNPMHMDRVAARRTPAGAPVVHGVHTLLWALESAIAAGDLELSLCQVRARFLRWVPLDETVTLRGASGQQGNLERLLVEVGGLAVCTLDLSYTGMAAGASGEPRLEAREEKNWQPEAAVLLTFPVELAMDELEGQSGSAYIASIVNVEDAFPHLCRAVGAHAVAETIACSYVVGMKAPGLHSMFAKLDLTFREPATSATQPALIYDVTKVDDRFRKCSIQVRGTSVAGTLEAFVRVPPVRQASMQELRAVVQPDEFRGVRALIVGGSRGLGELTAKLLAAGGAEIAITYVAGKAEAEAVLKDIVSAGGICHALPYNVLLEPAGQLRVSPETLPWQPTHLCYFATPTIARSQAAVLSAETLAEFNRYYLKGFYELCQELLRTPLESAGAPLQVLYPSTIFIESRPVGMTEYAMVKAAGEVLCADLNRSWPGIHVRVPRLPKLLTDQTAGVLPERDRSAIQALLPELRQMV